MLIIIMSLFIQLWTYSVTSLKKRLWYMSFPVSFNKYLRILTEHLLFLVSFFIYSGFRISRSQIFFKIVTLKICNIHRKTSVLAWTPENLLQTLVNIAKCLRTAFLKNTPELLCFFEYQVKNHRTVEYRIWVGIKNTA